MGGLWEELQMLLLNSQKDRSNKQTKHLSKIEIKANPFPNTVLSLQDRFTLVDTVMQFPIDRTWQIQVYIYKYNQKEYLDIRQYHFNNKQKVFQPTKKGIRIPIEMLPQLLIRLQRIDINSKRRSKNKFELELP